MMRILAKNKKIIRNNELYLIKQILLYIINYINCQ